MDLVRELADARRRAVGALGGAGVVLDGPANLQRGWEAAGGWLALSVEWLAFTPHRVNRRVGRLLVPTAAVRRAWPCWTWVFGLVPVCPNSVAIETAGGRVYRFVVADRQAWATALNHMRAGSGTAADGGA